ncbi:MAG: hypothetical protein ACXQS8_00240 [Candidatus Helarchaeales archaeon]
MKIFVENPEPDLENGKDLYQVAKVYVVDRQGKEHVAFYAIARDKRALDHIIREKEATYFPGLLTLEMTRIKKTTFHLSQIELPDDFLIEEIENSPMEKRGGRVIDPRLIQELDLILNPIREVESRPNFFQPRELLTNAEIAAIEGLNDKEMLQIYLRENGSKPVWDLIDAIYNAITGKRFPELASFIVSNAETDFGKPIESTPH